MMNSVYEPDLSLIQLAWIVETFGPRGENWTYDNETAEIQFKRERDYKFFLLKWMYNS